mmetsp:Transcript_17427/g.48402  ORF Transcript_17427/g.48402 Transcript_17427/m.48402 type:complete len:208 (+) Transcript_17427:4817-5440(+)|eukprot:CAMPEP_0202357896 /NCGR_PEP_ID=MMETSP1126-20121109/11746_1 /ASSEMBLY_ACC=CAM_ASM_000457 /TAXON_ID=3047 /ORGANISM="Dunaliella tertiolecta, Strain CCMP1320" /LENGTH=207 /DNA_ID=CAMNT_0048950881 /DNA_START=44 /DNA_END=667 /DNA_ORIENTATION=-
MNPSLLICVCTAILTSLYAWTRQCKARHLQQLQAALLQETSELRREAARLNTPSTFSKHAKALRKATAKEKELAALHDRPRDPRQWDWQDQLLLAMKVLQSVLFVGAALIWWKWPVAELPPGVAWPFGSTLATPHGKLLKSGFVAAVPWMLLCNRATNAWLQVASDTFNTLGCFGGNLPLQANSSADDGGVAVRGDRERTSTPCNHN